ncbi:hypothetical protein [Lactiplantibacillus plantarum]|uniref:hypothetical protein n=1 Tax=Lactiplantibacillus plantarum TaxID=1590 RepID=UPI0007B55FAA|nr:hypothetical protein [Lactiplantibacillus plantarum]
MQNYILSNIELVKDNGKGTSLSTPLRNIKGLSTMLRTIFQLTLANTSNQYIDNSIYTLECTTHRIFSQAPKAFQRKFNEHHVRYIMHMLALAGLVQPLDWKHLNKYAKKTKMELIKARRDKAGYQGLVPVYAIADLSDIESIHPERLTRKMSATVNLSYLSIACQYDYNTAERVYANLNNWQIICPTVNQMIKLATDVRTNKVLTLDEIQPYFKPARAPKGYEQPTNAKYYRQTLQALDAIGWLASQGLAFDTVSKIRDYVKLPEDLNANVKVLYDKSVIK